MMRVLISAETFLPATNGVTNSVLRVLTHLRRTGHEALVVAPGTGPKEVGGVPIVRVSGRRLPLYRSVTVGHPHPSEADRLVAGFQPDVVHLAAPAFLGGRLGAAAASAGIPTVAVFQTDVPAFLSHYGLGIFGGQVWRHLRRIHNRADVTLAPSSATLLQLSLEGFERVRVWGRGVDHEQFNPQRANEELRRTLRASRGDVLVGYMGRLANEKKVELLEPLRHDPGTRLVVIGDGPARQRLQSVLPGAHFTGMLHGETLGTALASLDVFVHTGPDETFCQAIQEAMACALPVVAPASGGPLDLVDHSRTGYLYPRESPLQLVAAVRHLAGNPDLRASFGRAGWAAVRNRTWALIGDELIGLYRELVEQRRAQALPRAS
jgi:phosphatidylinositol alpha 1,6-mannosyltransferase